MEDWLIPLHSSFHLTLESCLDVSYYMTTHSIFYGWVGVNWDA